MNISSTVRFDKNWGVGKKIGVLAFQKVAKTGNVGQKKSSGKQKKTTTHKIDNR